MKLTKLTALVAEYQMKLTKLTALVAGMGLAAIAGTASAGSLGEVWVTDQKDGTMYIYDQAELNSDPANANPDKVDLVKASKKAKQPVFDGRNHLIGFNNKKGLDPESRAVLAYLHGEIQIWPTQYNNINKLKPIFTDQAPTTENSLHMCGPNPQSTEIMCSSIGGKELIAYSTDYATDTYARTDAFALEELIVNIDGLAAPGTDAAVAALDLDFAKPICNNYSTDGSLVFVTTTNTGGPMGGGTKGVLVLERAGMTIINAIAGTGTGCGLVNSQGGEAMFTNAGSNSDSDTETVMRWDYATVGTVGGPTITQVLPVAAGDNGDVHGAQLAGLGGPFLWELMRLDNEVHVLDPGTLNVVNTIDLTSATGIENLGGDVLDRSALGTRMYMSTRGYAPITAISAFIDVNRNPGVTVVGTLFGYSAWGIGHAEIRSGEDGVICVDDDGDAHSHDDQECDEGSETVLLDNADPHGLKSLNYLSGGF
jgi:hypothetical protein